jgi:hypothetical protein
VFYLITCYNVYKNIDSIMTSISVKNSFILAPAESVASEISSDGVNVTIVLKNALSDRGQWYHIQVVRPIGEGNPNISQAEIKTIQCIYRAMLFSIRTKAGEPTLAPHRIAIQTEADKTKVLVGEDAVKRVAQYGKSPQRAADKFYESRPGDGLQSRTGELYLERFDARQLGYDTMAMTVHDAMVLAIKILFPSKNHLSFSEKVSDNDSPPPPLPAWPPLSSAESSSESRPPSPPLPPLARGRRRRVKKQASPFHRSEKQDASEHAHSEATPRLPKTGSSDCFSIDEGRNRSNRFKNAVRLRSIAGALILPCKEGQISKEHATTLYYELLDPNPSRLLRPNLSSSQLQDLRSIHYFNL